MLRGRAWLAAAVLCMALVACEPAPPLLNSERIEQVFGSYGITVLSSDLELRISSLYSTDDGIRTTRTLAIVAWPPGIDARLAEAHAAIVAGASIGATFEAAGWEVRKHHLYLDRIESPGTLSRLMRIPPGSTLAAHGYALAVAREEDELHYATIAEIHHPAYLDLPMLEEIYGEADASAVAGTTRVSSGVALRRQVDEGLARLEALPSAGGE